MKKNDMATQTIFFPKYLFTQKNRKNKQILMNKQFKILIFAKKK